MRAMRQFFIFAFSVSAAFFLLSGATRAQQMPDYLFLQVLDSGGRPVPDATVEIVPDSAKVLKTYEEGRTSFELTPNFKVSKNGYFPFYNLGIDKDRVNWRTDAKIELLKIPQTPAERRALGAEQSKREFLWAAKSGDAETLRRLLKAGIKPNLTTGDLRGIPGPKNISAMSLAAASGNGAAVVTLLKAGVDVRNKGEPFRSILITYLQADPFFWRKPPDDAARREMLRLYEKGFESLVKAGADVSVKDYNKRSILMLAALSGYAQIVKFLLARGFSPNETSEYGETVLAQAANGDWEGTYSKIEVVGLLLKAGAKPDLPAAPGCSSPLAVAAGRGDIEVIRLLLESGAKINRECGSALAAAVERKKTAAARLLIEAGADLNVPVGYNGQNVLMTAAGKEDAATVKMLLDKGFPVDKASAGNWTALFSSISSPYRPNLEVMRLLLDAGADTNRTSGENTNCYTPLILAALNRNYDAMRLLIEYKADINRACGSGVSVLSNEIRRGEIEPVKKMIEMGADVKTDSVRRSIEFLRANRQGYSYPQKIDELIGWLETLRAKE